MALSLDNLTIEESSTHSEVSPSLYNPQFPSVIDSTMLAAFDSCPQKFYYEFIENLRGRGRSIDLHAGAAFARGVEVARMAYWFGEQSPADALAHGFAAFTAEWGDFEPMIPDHPKDFVNTGGALLDYFREYPLDSDPIQPFVFSGDRPAIEFTFAHPLPINHPVTGLPLIYAGRLDLLGYYNNTLAIIDEKTTKALGQSWASKWKMRGQFLGYCWAMQQNGLPVSTVLIRGVAIQKTQYSHMQVVQSYPQHMIDQWHANMLERVRWMVEAYCEGSWNVKRSYSDACEAYGGCGYIDLCMSEDPSIWFDSFARVGWNPLDKDPTRRDAEALDSTLANAGL